MDDGVFCEHSSARAGTSLLISNGRFKVGMTKLNKRDLMYVYTSVRILHPCHVWTWLLMLQNLIIAYIDAF